MVVCFQLYIIFFFLMIRRPPRSTQSRSSAASDVYKRQMLNEAHKALHTLAAEMGYALVPVAAPDKEQAA